MAAPRCQPVRLHIHVPDVSTEELLLNPELLPDCRPGDVIELLPPDDEYPPGGRLVLPVATSSIAKDLIAPGAAVSVAKAIADLFGLKARSQVVVYRLSSLDEASLDFVELSVKEQYISRSEIWHLQRALVSASAHVGKLISHGGLRVQVQRLTMRGEPCLCGLIAKRTKLVFRSRSQHFVCLIQMSREMWLSADNGEPYADRTVGFVARLLEEWTRRAVTHALTLVLFSRTLPAGAEPRTPRAKPTAGGGAHAGTGGADGGAGSGAGGGAAGAEPSDVYKVVCERLTLADWSPLVRTLKEEMNRFRRCAGWRELSLPLRAAPPPRRGPAGGAPAGGAGADASTAQRCASRASGEPLAARADAACGDPAPSAARAEPSLPRTRGEVGLSAFAPAARGNLIEAINLALSALDEPHLNRELSKTGQQVVVISPSAGVFECGRELLDVTNARMEDTGIGCDLVCLGRPPRHTVPLLLTTPRAAGAPGGVDGGGPSATPPGTPPAGGGLVWRSPEWLNCMYTEAPSPDPARSRAVCAVRDAAADGGGSRAESTVAAVAAASAARREGRLRPAPRSASAAPSPAAAEAALTLDRSALDVRVAASPVARRGIPHTYSGGLGGSGAVGVSLLHVGNVGTMMMGHAPQGVRDTRDERLVGSYQSQLSHASLRSRSASPTSSPGTSPVPVEPALPPPILGLSFSGGSGRLSPLHSPTAAHAAAAGAGCGPHAGPHAGALGGGSIPPPPSGSPLLLPSASTARLGGSFSLTPDRHGAHGAHVLGGCAGAGTFGGGGGGGGGGALGSAVCAPGASAAMPVAIIGARCGRYSPRLSPRAGPCADACAGRSPMGALAAGGDGLPSACAHAPHAPSGGTPHWEEGCAAGSEVAGASSWVGGGMGGAVGASASTLGLGLGPPGGAHAHGASAAHALSALRGALTDNPFARHPAPAARLVPAPGARAISARQWLHVVNSTLYRPEQRMWMSLCEPALLPLATDDVPPTELDKDRHYDMTIYQLFAPAPAGDGEDASLRLMDELICQRLEQDFQMIEPHGSAPLPRVASTATVGGGVPAGAGALPHCALPLDGGASGAAATPGLARRSHGGGSLLDGGGLLSQLPHAQRSSADPRSACYLCMGHSFHLLTRMDDQTIEVKIWQRRKARLETPVVPYRYLVWGARHRGYAEVATSFMASARVGVQPAAFNWNHLDFMVAGGIWDGHVLLEWMQYRRVSFCLFSRPDVHASGGGGGGALAARAGGGGGGAGSELARPDTPGLPQTPPQGRHGVLGRTADDATPHASSPLATPAAQSLLGAESDASSCTPAGAGRSGGGAAGAAGAAAGEAAEQADDADADALGGRSEEAAIALDIDAFRRFARAVAPRVACIARVRLRGPADARADSELPAVGADADAEPAAGGGPGAKPASGGARAEGVGAGRAAARPPPREPPVLSERVRSAGAGKRALTTVVEMDSVAHARRAWRFTLKWRVSVGVAVEELLALLRRRARHAGLRVMQLPIARETDGASGRAIGGPFSPHFSIPCSAAVRELAARALCAVGGRFDFVLERLGESGSPVAPGARYVQRACGALVELLDGGLAWTTNTLEGADEAKAVATALQMLDELCALVAREEQRQWLTKPPPDESPSSSS